MRSIILITVALSLFIQANAADAGSFKFYVFACEWAGSVCQSNDCTQNQGSSTQFWNIHGLWPSDGSETLFYCTDEKFNPDEISSLSTQLAEYWNGLYSSADAFHAHEWAKHGTCSNMTQLGFFSSVLQFAQSLNIYSVLEKGGITPGGSYDCSQVAQVIQQQLGVQSFSVQSDQGYLSAIQVCADGKLNVIDCPSGSSDEICQGQVQYPTYSYYEREIREIIRIEFDYEITVTN